MKPTEFEGCNHKYGPPEGWTDDQCQTIPAMVFEHEIEILEGSGATTKQLFVITGWKPSEADLKKLNEGGLVYLQVYGGMPPVCVYTVDDEGKPNFD